jgi:hypothetical protein
MHSLAFFGKQMHSLALKKHHLRKNQTGHPTKSQDSVAVGDCKSGPSLLRKAKKYYSSSVSFYQ